jgi:FkbM family methyltransferase
MGVAMTFRAALRRRASRMVSSQRDKWTNRHRFPDRAFRRVWIDVGAHLGEKTFAAAVDDPDLVVYAFEPNLPLALRLANRLPNYIALPMAVAEVDGSSVFFVNTCDVASSLLPFDQAGVERWRTSEPLAVAAEVVVPTIRLDTFMRAAGIDHVDFLKVDAQGADLAVVRSAGDLLRVVGGLEIEVETSATPLYEGAPTKTEVVEYLRERGFALQRAEAQSDGQEENLFFVRSRGGAEP